MTDKPQPIGLEEVARRIDAWQRDRLGNRQATDDEWARIWKRSGRQAWRLEAADLIRTLDAARAGKGIVSAPHKATDNMAETGLIAYRTAYLCDALTIMKIVYQNMLAAAPAPTEDKADD